MKKYFVKVLILMDRKFNCITKISNYRFYFKDTNSKFYYVVNSIGGVLKFSFNDYSLIGKYYEEEYFNDGEF